MEEYRRLDELCDINMGQSPDSNSYNQEKDGLPFFQGNADFGELYPTTRMWCNKPTKIVEKDTLLISVRAPIGALNFATEKCCIGRGLAGITPKEDVNLKYIFYYLRHKKVELNSKGTGSTFKAIAKAALGETKIKALSSQEQVYYSEVLDKISGIINYQKEQLLLLDDLIKSRFVEMFGDPIKNPMGWTKHKLRDVCMVNPKKSNDSRLVDDLEVSFVAMPSVSERGDLDASIIKRYSEVRTGFTYFTENDVLFAKITPCMENGKGAVAVNLRNGVGFGSTEFHVLRTIYDKTNPYWVYYLTMFDTFRNEAERKMTGSAGQRRVPAAFLESYEVGVPPIDLQNQFATFVQQVDKLKVEVHNSLKETQLLFDSIMQKYFD